MAAQPHVSANPMWTCCPTASASPSVFVVYLLQGKLRREIDATSKEISQAAAAAAAAREQAGSSALGSQAPVTSVVVGQKRGRPGQAAAAAAAPAPEQGRSETDVLLAKIMSAELWRGTK